MVSKKNSTLYKAADIKLYIPEVLESGYGIVPTSSTVTQLSLGDALAIASMEYKNFGKLDFKKFHPAGSLGKKLKTVEDLMYIGGRIPFTGESTKMKLALKIISDKKLGVLVVKNKKGLTTGLCTDGDIKRSIQKYKDINELPIKKIMTRKPIFIYKDVLAAKALQIMNEKKITSLCVNDKKTKNRTIGVLHIHRVLEADVN